MTQTDWGMESLQAKQSKAKHRREQKKEKKRKKIKQGKGLQPEKMAERRGGRGPSPHPHHPHPARRPPRDTPQPRRHPPQLDRERQRQLARPPPSGRLRRGGPIFQLPPFPSGLLDGRCFFLAVPAPVCPHLHLPPHCALCFPQHGLGCNLAGGTHHAFPAAGSGFCVLNDLAVPRGPTWLPPPLLIS